MPGVCHRRRQRVSFPRQDSILTRLVSWRARVLPPRSYLRHLCQCHRRRQCQCQRPFLFLLPPRLFYLAELALVVKEDTSRMVGAGIKAKLAIAATTPAEHTVASIASQHHQMVTWCQRLWDTFLTASRHHGFSSNATCPERTAITPTVRTHGEIRRRRRQVNFPRLANTATNHADCLALAQEIVLQRPPHHQSWFRRHQHFCQHSRRLLALQKNAKTASASMRSPGVGTFPTRARPAIPLVLLTVTVSCTPLQLKEELT